MERIKDLISIVVLHYNRPSDLKKCLKSIRKNTTIPYEIILVDNGSLEGSAKEFVRSLNDLLLIDLDKNIAMETASGMGVSLAQGKYVLFLTDDTVMTPNYLNTFLRHAENYPEVGIIGPKSNFVSGPQKLRNVTYSDIWELDRFAKNLFRANIGRLTPYTRLVGFCMFIRWEVIQKIGWMDPCFGFGFDDDDFSLRANLAGFKTAIAQDVFIHHTGGPQGKGDPYHQHLLMEAWSKFKKKWGLPPELPLSEYRPKALLNRAFDPNRDYVPLPDPRDVEPYIYRKARVNYPVSPLVSAPSTSRWTSKVPAKEIAQGLGAYYLGRQSEAVDIFRKLATRYEKSFHIHFGLGCILAKTGNIEEAISHFKLAMDLQPNSCKPGNALGRALIKVGRPKEAEHAFEQADKVSLYSHQAKFNLIRYYMSEGKTDQAIDTALQAYHREPNNNKVITVLAHLLITSKRYREAEEYLRHYLSLVSKDPDAFLLLFKAYWDNGDKEKALEVLRIIKSLTQNDIKISNRIQSLLDASRKEVKDDEAILVILRAAGSLYDNLNWEDDFSIDFLVEGDILEGLYELAKEIYENGGADEAFIIYKELNRLAPGHPMVHNDLAAILWHKDDVEAALNHISLALKLNPRDKDIVWNSGQILLALGRYEDAKNVYQEYLNIHPNDPEIREEITRISSLHSLPETCSTTVHVVDP